jgi:hypothetical protein
LEVIFTAGQLQFGRFDLAVRGVDGSLGWVTSTAPPIGSIRIRPALARTLDLSASVTTEGVSLRTAGGDIAPGCSGAGRGVTVPKVGGDHDCKGLTPREAVAQIGKVEVVGAAPLVAQGQPRRGERREPVGEDRDGKGIAPDRERSLRYQHGGGDGPLRPVRSHRGLAPWPGSRSARGWQPAREHPVLLHGYQVFDQLRLVVVDRIGTTLPRPRSRARAEHDGDGGARKPGTSLHARELNTSTAAQAWGACPPDAVVEATPNEAGRVAGGSFRSAISAETTAPDTFSARPAPENRSVAAAGVPRGRSTHPG